MLQSVWRGEIEVARNGRALKSRSCARQPSCNNVFGISLSMHTGRFAGQLTMSTLTHGSRDRRIRFGTGFGTVKIFRLRLVCPNTTNQ